MSEMIERVAKAIREEHEISRMKGSDVHFGNLALAAIKAMRDPTDKMIRAAKHKMDMEDAYGGIPNCYGAMIEEAIKQ